MKRGLIVLIIVFLGSLAYAQEEMSETVTNRLSVEFHAVTGTDEVTINLPKYFGRDANFVYKESEHVMVELDSDTHIATMKSTDPEWRGIETIVFATDSQYLEEEKREGGILLPRNVTKVKINVSKEDVAMDTDAFTQIQFETVLGNLTSEPVDIEALMSNESFRMIINDEMYFNMTFKNDKPKMDMLWRLRANSNMTSARYREMSDVMTFTFIMFILFSLSVLVLYVYFGYAESIKSMLLAPNRTRKAVERDIEPYKRSAMGSLVAIQKKVGKEKPSKLYKDSIAVMNKFLSEALGIKGGSIDKVNEKISKMGLQTGISSKLSIYFSERKARVYSGNEINEGELQNFISFLKSIVGKL